MRNLPARKRATVQVMIRISPEEAKKCDRIMKKLNIRYRSELARFAICDLIDKKEKECANEFAG